MNTNTTMKIIGIASAAAICTTGSWAAAPAQATTDTDTGGGNTSTSTSGVEDFGQVLAVRKMEMAHDHVVDAAARAAFAARAATSVSVCAQQLPSAPPAAYLPGGSVDAR